jgi:hypothetical protein
MLVLAIFGFVCTAALIFLLRFLFAISSETRPASGRIEPVSALHSVDAARVRKPAPVLTLIHSNPSRQVVNVHPGRRVAFARLEDLSLERNPQFKRG